MLFSYSYSYFITTFMPVDPSYHPLAGEPCEEASLMYSYSPPIVLGLAHLPVGDFFSLGTDDPFDSAFYLDFKELKDVHRSPPHS